MTQIDTAQLEPWIGNETTIEVQLNPETANLMAATLDREPDFKAGDILPPAWHWLYFHEPVPASGLGAEGHPKLGGFLPPVPLPRRMWAGGKFTFERPLYLGQPAAKRSTVKSVTPKTGRSGQLCFVIVEHEVWTEGERCLSEEQIIVYRDAPKAGQPQIQAKPAPTEFEVSSHYTSDPIMLFRYSALTFNSHRIHYDTDYCREVEGYPDIVVHGPLIATLLLDLCINHYNDHLTGFEYQARSPLFNPHPFSIHSQRIGDTAEVWAANKNGGLAMKATARFGNS